MPMSNNDERTMTLRELAEAILALPAEQQGQRACYTMLDDEGFEVFEPVLEVRAEKNQVFLQGSDLYN